MLHQKITNKSEGRNEGMRGGIRQTENRQQNGRHNPTLSEVSLNVNGLNTSNKRHRGQNGLKKKPKLP